MKWNQIFNRGKRAEQVAAGSLHSLLLPSLLGISVCLLTLCSLTWAWFTAQVHTDTTTIQSAYIEVYAASSADAFVPAGAATQDAEAVTMTYAVPVSPEPSTVETEGEDDTESKPVYVPTELKISGDKFYFVAQGTAQKAYLKITAGEKVCYTALLHPTDPTVTKNDNGNDITPAYTVYCVDLSGKDITDTTNVKLTLCWGDNTNVKDPIDPTPVRDGESNKTITKWPGDAEIASNDMLIQWPVDNSETTTPDGDTKQDETPAVEEPKDDQPTTGDQTPTTDGNQDTPQTPDTNPTQGGETGGSSDGNTPTENTSTPTVQPTTESSDTPGDPAA